MPSDPILPAVKPNEAWFEDTWWWSIKLRLQWSGWLQYAPNLVFALLMLLLAGLGAIIGVWPWVLIGVPLGVAALLLANLVFDVATVRYGIHPREGVPLPKAKLDAFDVMRARVSCRSFQKRALTQAHREKITGLAALYTQPENCIGARPIRLEYLTASLSVWPVVGAREFLVAVAERTYHEEAVIDVGRSLQKVVHAATQMGLASCWIGPGADPSSIAEHLGERFDPSKDHVICVCAIGYASRYKPLFLRVMQRSQRWRKGLGELFYADTACKTPIEPDATAYSAFERLFESCQWAPSSYNAQPTRAVCVTEHERLVRMDFCAATKSRYYAMVALGIWLANWEIGCAALGLEGFFVKKPTLADQRPDLPRYVISWQRNDADLR